VTVKLWASIWLAALVGALCALPAAAVAAGGSSSSSGGSLGGGLTAPGGVPTTSTTTPTIISTATASTSGGSGLSGTNAIVIALGAVVILGGISYFIWRDARRRAPVASRSDDADHQNRPGSKAPPKARKLSAAERKRRKRGRAKR
jgi:hypothetical protein